MKKFSKFILYIFMLVACNINVAFAEILNFKHVTLEKLDFTENTTITEDANFTITKLNITTSIVVKNMGIFNANIYVCKECRLYVQNSGTFNATYDFAEGARLTQIITSDDEIKSIGVKSGFDIEVRKGNKISMKKLFDYGVDIGKLVLDNALLMYDLDGSINLDSFQIVLIGDVIIYVNSIDDIKGKDVLKNVSGDGRVSFYTMDDQPLSSVQSKVEDNAVRADIVHETDYDKNHKGEPLYEFLDLLREVNPDSKLLQHLDSTYDMAEFNRILHESVITNPINLMRPIREFNAMKSYSDFSNYDVGNVNLVPIYMSADNFYLAGLQFALYGQISDSVNVSAAVYGAYGDYSDDLDDYSMTTFGGNVGLKYDNDHFVFRNLIGGGHSVFDAGLVFDGTQAITKPSGINVYGASDIGYRLHASDNINILPFIGAVADYETVEKFHDTDFRGRGGGEISYHTNGEEINYEYSAMAAYETDGAMSFILRIGALSEFDAAGADVSIGVRHDEFATSYQIMLNGKISF